MLRKYLFLSGVPPLSNLYMVDQKVVLNSSHFLRSNPVKGLKNPFLFHFPIDCILVYWVLNIYCEKEESRSTMCIPLLNMNRNEAENYLRLNDILSAEFRDAMVYKWEQMLYSFLLPMKYILAFAWQQFSRVASAAIRRSSRKFSSIT